jgi:enamine deaminase RidA (YjgF/YER057c/UK114 family)
MANASRARAPALERYDRGMSRSLVSSGSPYEPIIGFSRAIRIGPLIAVSGTAPIAADGTTVAPGDCYHQTRRCLEIIVDAVRRAGGTPDAIIRTRVYLTDPTTWRDAARAHGEVFHELRPASTFVAVAGLIDPAWLVEIEADAYVG